MRISEDLQCFHLHDSDVDRIVWDSEHKILIISLTLCEALGEEEAIANNEYFGQTGTLTFHSVERLKEDHSTMPLREIPWETISVGVIDIMHDPSLDNGSLEGVTVDMDVHSFQPSAQSSGLIYLQFAASYFEWTPEDNHAA